MRSAGKPITPPATPATATPATMDTIHGNERSSAAYAAPNEPSATKTPWPRLIMPPYPVAMFTPSTASTMTTSCVFCRSSVTVLMNGTATSQARSRMAPIHVSGPARRRRAVPEGDVARTRASAVAASADPVGDPVGGGTEMASEVASTASGVGPAGVSACGANTEKTLASAPATSSSSGRGSGDGQSSSLTPARFAAYRTDPQAAR